MKTIGLRLQYFSFFIPFRLLLPFFLLCIYVMWYMLQQQVKNPESSFAVLVALLLKLVLIFFAILLVFSFLGVFISYLIFLIERKNIVAKAVIRMQSQSALGNNVLYMSLQNILPPLLGNIRYRLVDNTFTSSEKFKLKTDKWQLFSTLQQGEYNLLLPAIKQYEMQQLVIYFEDFFQLFSFTSFIPYNATLTIKPEDFEQEPKNINPRKTVESNIRIEQLKRTEGEYINYKDFENHDDVRRIVWKIYARNKELVVRTPEIFDPYASKINFYASFFNDAPPVINKYVHFQLLNFYKTEVWSTYRNLAAGKLEVVFIPDQTVNTITEENKNAKVKTQIAMVDWQQENTLTDYCYKSDAAVVCISSFTPPKQVEQLLQIHNAQLQIVFIKLSEAYNKPFITDWLKWLFIQVEDDAVERNRTWFALSGLKRQLIKNEQRLEAVLGRFLAD